MKCKHFSRFFGVFAAFATIFAISFGGGIEAVADEVEITKVSALTGRSFFGDTIPAKYYLNGAATSFNFEYFDSFINPSVGLNVDLGSMISSPNAMATYDFVVYRGILPTYDATYDISVDDFYLRFGDYARGGFALSWFGLSETVAWNNASNYPDNYSGEFGAVRANSAASSSMADYYGIMYFSQQSGYTYKYRPIYYSFDNGGVLDSLYFSGIRPNATGQGVTAQVYLIVICPYIGSSMSGEPPAQTTTTTDSSSSGGAVTVINNNVDMTQTNGLLSNIISALQSLGQSILQGIQNIFIPSPGFLDDQLAEIQDSFAWYDDIKQIGVDFSGAMENQANASAPVISIPTLSSRGHIYTKNSEMVLDLSDYQEAVLSVRAILSVLLWIFFLWRLYCRLPDIIHGSGMIIGDGSRIMDELDNRDSQNVNDDVNFHDHHFGR